jgi:hypothetical protein
VAGGKRGTTGGGVGEGAGRRRARGAAGGPDRGRAVASRGDGARRRDMVLVDPWGALLAGLLEAEGEPAATEDDPGDEGERGGGREPAPAAPVQVRRTTGERGRKGGRQPGPAGGR